MKIYIQTKETKMKQIELIQRLVQERNAVAEASAGNLGGIEIEVVGLKIVYAFTGYDGTKTDMATVTQAEFIDIMLPPLKDAD